MHPDPAYSQLFVFSTCLGSFEGRLCGSTVQHGGVAMPRLSSLFVHGYFSATYEIVQISETSSMGRLTPVRCHSSAPLEAA